MSFPPVYSSTGARKVIVFTFLHRNEIVVSFHAPVVGGFS